MKKSIYLIAVSLLLVTALGFAPAAKAQPPRQDGGNVSNQGVARAMSAADTLAFWTPERMAAAVPPPGFERTEAAQLQPQTQLQTSEGTAQYVAGYGPGGSPSGVVNGTLANASTVAPNHTYPFTFSRGQFYPPRVYTSWPMITLGKIFFQNDGYGAGLWVCSGTSVTSGTGGNENLVLTAGHCVAAGDNLNWSYNMIFVPGRRDGANPNGYFSENYLTTRGSWFASSNSREDMGFMIATSNPCGTLAHCYGAQGVAWGQPDNQEFVATGYPQAAPFNGEKMTWCISHTGLRDTWMGGTGELPIGIGCDMTGGSSGGAWFIQFKQHTVSYANSINNYKYTSPAQPNAMYGVYFGSAFASLWDFSN